MTSARADTGRTLHAVLFDMDGTLLDSEKVWDIALDDLAHELGGSLSQAGRARMVGTPLGRSIALLHGDLGIDADAESSGSFLLGRTAELFSRPLPWKPGARELLDAVGAAGVPAALVTSTHRHLTELALRTIGADRFTVSVCGDEVTATKPKPEPYLQALRLLGLGSAHCVAIEDSPVGLTSALGAGLPVLVVPSEVPVEPQPGMTIRDSLVGVTVDDLEALATAAGH